MDADAPRRGFFSARRARRAVLAARRKARKIAKEMGEELGEGSSTDKSGKTAEKARKIAKEMGEELGEGSSTDKSGKTAETARKIAKEMGEELGEGSSTDKSGKTAENMAQEPAEGSTKDASGGSASGKSDKPRICGLCGKTRNLTMTECCDNYICDDYGNYVMFSYKRNSCSRNHDRHTICSHHHIEGHEGSWKTCTKCKEDFPPEVYADYVSNDYNFEKLEISKPPIICSNCGFQSVEMDEFTFCLRNGSVSWFCAKDECNKKAYQYP